MPDDRKWTAADSRAEALLCLRTRLEGLYRDQGLSWRKIAKRGEFAGINHTTLWSLVNDPNFSPSAAVARKLGLPPERIRKAADLESVEQQAAADELAASYNCNWSQLVRHILNLHMQGIDPFSFEEVPMK